MSQDRLHQRLTIQEKESSPFTSQKIEVKTIGGLKMKGNLVLPTEFQGHRPAVLIVHGAARTFNPIATYKVIQESLAQVGFASLLVNSRGVGASEPEWQSEGDYFSQSLLDRVADEEHAWHYLEQVPGIDKEKLGILGISTGGHVSARLTERIPNIQSLVLLGPGAYPTDPNDPTRNAEDKPFGPSYSSAIRSSEEDRSLLTNSAAFAALSKYSGEMFVVYGADDKVVPQEVKEGYRRSIKGRSDSLFVQQQGKQHRLQYDPESTDPQDREKYDALMEQVGAFLGKTLQSKHREVSVRR